MEMGMNGLLPLQSAGDVRCLLKERHGSAGGGWCCASVVLVQQLDLANLALKGRWPLSGRSGPKVPPGNGISDASPNRAARLIFCNPSSAEFRRQHPSCDS
jgi:hypothetical protein